MDDKTKKTEQQWKEELTAEQFAVCRKKGTERAFTGAYHDSKVPGIYICVCCSAPLFASEHKFDSGTGWPSFYQAKEKDLVAYEQDNKLWMKRTEVLCNRCGSHLGHVFDDGPAPTGKRYCINSVALKLEPKKESE